jgi:hypothetical protein
MAITITWPADNAAVATEVRIYASTSRLADDTLGTPIATLPGNAVSFSWDPPTDNTVYYFRVAIDRGADTWLGPNQPFGYFSTTGPGAQQPIRGDWELGYFGRVPVLQMISGSALRTALGVDGIGSTISDTQIQYYYKFVREGKILFYPAGAVMTNVRWDQLYGLGLVYGTDDNGAYPAGAALTPFNQKKVIAIAGFNFLARCFKGSTLPTTTLVTTATADKEGSEWDQTMGRVNTNATLSWNAGSLLDDNTSVPVTTQGTFTQHLLVATSTPKTALHRGASSVIDSIGQASAASATYGYSPLLELQF